MMSIEDAINKPKRKSQKKIIRLYNICQSEAKPMNARKQLEGSETNQ